MPHAAHASTDLRAAVGGVRAFLLDLDGVIVLAGEAIPGAAEALTGLERRGMPYRIVTNTSAVSRETLSRWSAKLGAPIPPERFAGLTREQMLDELRAALVRQHAEAERIRRK